MGMYRWAVYFLKEWNVDCTHVYGFNMDEWSDSEGNTLDSADPAAFQNAMQQAFYGPLGNLTVPKEQRNFATKIKPSHISRKNCETKIGRGQACYGIRYRQDVSYCVLGAPFCSGVQFRRRVEKAAFQAGRQASPADNRAECDYQL